MSRRSQGSPGAHSKRRAGQSGRSVGGLRRLAAEADSRAQLHQLSHGRGAQVYRADAVYAPEEPAVRMPPKGPDRDAFADRLRPLKARGMSHLAHANELGLETWHVAALCKQYGISSPKPPKP